MPEFETPSGYISNLLGRVLNSHPDDSNDAADSASQSSYRRMPNSDSESDSDSQAHDTFSTMHSASSHAELDSEEEYSGSLSDSSDEADYANDAQSDTESIKNLPPASKRNLKEFRKVFADGPISPEKEKLYKVYSCALSKEILYQGRMYVTGNYICFNSRIFNVTNKFCLAFKDITLIEPRRMISIIPNGIEVGTLDGRRFVFASFGNRNSTLSFLRQLRKNREIGESDDSNSLSRSSSTRAAAMRGGSVPSLAVDPDASGVSSEGPSPGQNPGLGRSRSSTTSTQSSGVRAVRPAGLAATSVEDDAPNGAGASSPSGYNLKPDASPRTPGTTNLPTSSSNGDRSKQTAPTSSRPHSTGSTLSRSSSLTALQQTCDAFDFFTFRKSNGMPNILASRNAPTPAPAPLLSHKSHRDSHRDRRDSHKDDHHDHKDDHHDPPNAANAANTSNAASVAPSPSNAKRPKWPVGNLGPEEHAKTQLPDAHDNEKVLSTETIRAPPGVVANILAGNDTAWLKHFLVDVEKNRELSGLPPFPALQSDSERKYEYIKPLSGPVGPKQTRCKCTDKIEHWDFDSYIEILTTTLTPDVPAGSSFTTQTRAILAWGDDNTTVIRLGTWLEWTGKTWLKAAIEKGAVDGQTSYCKQLVAELTKKIHTKSSVTEKEAVEAGDGDTPKARKASSEPKSRPSKRSETTQKASDAIAAWQRVCIYLASAVLVLLVLVLHLWRKGRHYSPVQPEHAKDLFRVQQELELWQWLDERQQHRTYPRMSISDADLLEVIAASEKKIDNLKSSLCL